MARRLIESAERHGSTLYVQLRGRKLPDRLHPAAVKNALIRHGVTPAFVDLVTVIYRAPHLHRESSGPDEPAFLTGGL